MQDNYSVDRHIIDKINDYHDAVVSSSRDAIKNAINAGEELTRAKDMCEHSQFLTLVTSGFKFSQRTAYRYIQCFEYSANLPQLANLTEAYKYIEVEESKKKMLKFNSQNQRMLYRKQHNEKPDTWEAGDDEAWDEYLKAQKATDERIAKFKEQTSEEYQRKQADKAATDQRWDQLDDYFENEKNKADTLKGIKITNQNGAILTAIEQYLIQFDNNQQLEEIANIIKFCKHKGASLHAEINLQ